MDELEDLLNVEDSELEGEKAETERMRLDLTRLRTYPLKTYRRYCLCLAWSRRTC